MKNLILVVLTGLAASFSAQAAELSPINEPTNISDTAMCRAATSIAAKLADTYISTDLSCQKDSDCSEVHYLGGSLCGSRLVNSKGAAGHELLLENAEYKKMVAIEKDASRNNLCGPRPLCAPRPAGDLKCVALDSNSRKQCTFQMQ